jgi:hypothetical protein
MLPICRQAVHRATALLALLTKETSVVFLAGAGLAVVVRGGWRNWRGMLGFALALEAIAGPWYIYLTSGYGVYAVRGVTTGLSADSLRNPQSPGQRYEFVCPGRQPIAWTARA